MLDVKKNQVHNKQLKVSLGIRLCNWWHDSLNIFSLAQVILLPCTFSWRKLAFSWVQVQVNGCACQFWMLPSIVLSEFGQMLSQCPGSTDGRLTFSWSTPGYFSRILFSTLSRTEILNFLLDVLASSPFRGTLNSSSLNCKYEKPFFIFKYKFGDLLWKVPDSG